VTFIAFFAVNFLGFWLNRHFTFRAKREAAVAQAPRFYFVQGVSLALNLACMYLLVGVVGVNAVLASLSVSALFAIASFVAHRGWTFGERGRA
jgi:putative flippase GtrA